MFQKQQVINSMKIPQIFNIIKDILLFEHNNLRHITLLFTAAASPNSHQVACLKSIQLDEQGILTFRVNGRLYHQPDNMRTTFIPQHSVNPNESTLIHGMNINGMQLYNEFFTNRTAQYNGLSVEDILFTSFMNYGEACMNVNIHALEQQANQAPDILKYVKKLCLLGSTVYVHNSIKNLIE